MTTATTYEVKPPSAVLAEDVICQSFIQSSSTLAYACLLIRRGRHDLAAHVLHSLESKPASRFKDMVFYLQAQIGIETGDFAGTKRRLAPRVHQHPNDMVALALLASCIHLEWEDWQRRNPALDIDPASDPGTLMVARIEAPEAPRAESPAYRTVATPTVPSARAGFPSGPAPVAADPLESAPPESAGGYVPLEAALSAARVPEPRGSASGSFAEQAARASSAGDGDFGLYQSLAADPNTRALSLWNAGQKRSKATCKKPELESLVASLPELLPGGLAEPIRALEAGEIHKVCFSFQGMTVTSMHTGGESLGLVTGNMNQSLLTMVRAENIFLKGAGAAAARVGAP